MTNKDKYPLTKHIVKMVEPKKGLKQALVKCPICKDIRETRVRSDSSALCRKCSLIEKGRRQAEQSPLEGDSHSGSQYYKLYNQWRMMNRRCYDPRTKGYNTYGAVGVTVCDEWKNSYSKFKQWALANYWHSGDLQLDKDELCEAKGISPKVYSPDTCLLKTRVENNANRKLTKDQAKDLADKLDKKLLSIEDAAEIYDCSRHTILTATKEFRKLSYQWGKGRWKV